MTRKKVIAAIKEIGENYHYTQIENNHHLNGRYFPNNIVLMTLSYLMNRNHLIIGDPGWGKTTLAQILSSRLSGTPFDLFESLTIEGHPGLFTEKWKARPHYGELTKGKESVIWQGGFGLDSFIVDEIRRISPDVQDEMLEGIRTGRWAYMNDVLYEGKKPSFFTMNDRDNGNGELIPPLEDRIDIVTEEAAASPLNDYRRADKQVRDNLTNPQVTTEALTKLRNIDFGGFKETIHKNRQGDYLTQEEKQSIQEEIDELSPHNGKWSNDALYFLWTFAAELNYNQKYSKKRSRDPISDDAHDKNYAGVYVKNGFSARPHTAAQIYSQGLAWILGDEKVDADHVRYILPYVTAHKFAFTDDFRDAHGNDQRTDYQDLHLARELINLVQEHYEESVKPLKNIITRIQQGKVRVKDCSQGTFEIEGKIKTIDDYDHPLMKHIIQKKILEHKSDL